MGTEFGNQLDEIFGPGIRATDDELREELATANQKIAELEDEAKQVCQMVANLSVQLGKEKNHSAELEGRLQQAEEILGAVLKVGDANWTNHRIKRDIQSFLVPSTPATEPKAALAGKE